MNASACARAALGSPRPFSLSLSLSLSDRVRRLCPSRTDPEAFHEEKSEIEHALRRLARQGAP
jgi:hypothetical protein